MMTDDRNIDEYEPPEGGNARVVRDPSFVRIFADSVFVQDLGRDIDLCLIQYGQPLTHFVSTDTEISVEASNCVTEAGRIRLSWPVAINIAMNLLSRGIESGRVKGDKLIEHLREEVDAKKVGDAKEAEGVSDDI